MKLKPIALNDDKPRVVLKPNSRHTVSHIVSTPVSIQTIAPLRDLMEAYFGRFFSTWSKASDTSYSHSEMVFEKYKLGFLVM